MYLAMPWAKSLLGNFQFIQYMFASLDGNNQIAIMGQSSELEDSFEVGVCLLIIGTHSTKL